MKPFSPHWADQTAVRIVAQVGDKDEYTVASGITPSGTVHIGNFREVITVDLVARALKSIGKKVRFIYSWDDFDTFRKVPVNLPNQEMLSEHLWRPISRVPDPYEEKESYAAGNIARFERELDQVGSKPEFIYQHSKYENGDYAEGIRKALENRDQIAATLNEFRKEPLAKEWLPTAIYCDKCGRDKMKSQRYDGEWNYSYECESCGHAATVDIRETKNLKLNWRTDWPMRWAYEGVDFEPGGKDHSSQGGSYDTGKTIVDQIYGGKAPIYLQYDFVMVKGMGGKMSSSKGQLISLGEALEVYDGQMVRWIFAMQRPNHDFSIAFDSDVIKVYDEFDRSEAQAFEPAPDKPNKKYDTNRRVYELSTLDAQMPQAKPFRPGFRVLCNRLQICDGDIERTIERYYSADIKTEQDRKFFENRSKCAWNWLEKHAPEEFCYRLHAEPVTYEMTDLDRKAMHALTTLVSNEDLDAIEAKDLNQKIYDDVIRGVGVDAKDFFRVVYQKLIGRDQGPRLPGFIKEIGADRIGELLREV